MRWTKPDKSRTSLVAPSLVATLALALAGCSGDADDSATPESPTASASSSSPTAEASQESESPSATESESAQGTSISPTEPSTTVESTEEAPEAAGVQPPPPGSSPKAMLLGKTELPGLNSEHAWRPIATENRERRRPVWACQVTDFTSIGATDVWVRRFVGQPGGAQSAQARHAVVTFVDPVSARRAYAVLQAWHDRCKQQLTRRYQNVRVDDAARAVQVAGGEAEWRLATYGPVQGDPDASYFDATGYVRKGKRISLVTMVNVGQDYNYPAGKEPIVGAVRNAATKLRG